MSAIADTFVACQEKRRTALIPYLTAGFPDKRNFRCLLESFERSGADMIEIGIPFSDPLADGPVIQHASQKALEDGINVKRTFDLLQSMQEKLSTPRIIMSYFNPIRSYGLARFIDHALRAGVSGIVVPDLIWEEGAQFERQCRAAGLDLVYLVARTTAPSRRADILKRSSGFVYLVSITGVTGSRASFSTSLLRWIHQVKKESPLPLCVGFGISNSEQAQRIARKADGIIIGSAIIDLIQHTNGSRPAIKRVETFIRDIRKGINHG